MWNRFWTSVRQFRQSLHEPLTLAVMAICDTVRSQKRPVDRFKQVGTTDCCEPSWCLPKDVRQMDDPWMILASMGWNRKNKPLKHQSCKWLCTLSDGLEVPRVRPDQQPQHMIKLDWYSNLDVTSWTADLLGWETAQNYWNADHYEH